MPKPKRKASVGNKNALKHGAYAKQGKTQKKIALRTLEESISRLEDINDLLFDQMHRSKDTDELIKLSNAFTNNSVAIFTGHRTIAFVSGTATPLDEAYAELKTLDPSED